MSDLRSLLRFDEKLAAEGRRLQNLGGPSMRWAAPTVLVVAVLAHALILLLPAVRSASASPPVRPVPDFPRVWVVAPPAPPSPVPPVARPSLAVTDPPVPTDDPPMPPIARRPLAAEPVPEPAPDIALNTIPADFGAIIPNPNPPPLAAEIGPPASVPPPPAPPAEPVLIEKVPPVYPVAARSLGAEARVTLRLRVLADGSVGGATVLDCSRTGLGFEVAALEAVRRWRYEPDPLRSGVRRVIVRVQFQQQPGVP